MMHARPEPKKTISFNNNNSRVSYPKGIEIESAYRQQLLLNINFKKDKL